MGGALVLDASALGVLPDLRDQVKDRRLPAVLTPNVDELGRLLVDQVPRVLAGLG